MKIKTLLLSIKYIAFHPIRSWRVFTPKTKRRIKKLAFVFLIVALSVPGYLWYEKKYGNIEEAEAGWWNDAWMYRKSITVSNSSGSALTDFQVKILDNKDLSADITAGKIQTDLDDLRFTDISGTVLSYWIEDATTTSVDVWVKIPSVPTTGATAYFYYGNTQATSEQNGNKVFEFFDDFSGDLSKWTNACSATITSGYLSIPNNSSCDAVPMYANNLNYSDTTGYIFELKGKFSSGGNGRLQLYQRRRNANGYMSRFWITGTSTTYYQEYTGSYGANNNVGSNNMSADTWYTLKVQVNGSNNTYYVNNTSVGSYAASASLSPFSDFTVGLGEYLTAVQYDDVRVRKYASTDPSAGTPATEEKGGGPVAYWSFDEGRDTTAYDASSNRVSGTLYSMSSTSDPNSGWQNEDKCISGKCLGFDGTNDDVEFGLNKIGPLIDGASSSTVSMWVKYSSLAGAANKYGNVIYASRQASANSNIWLNLRSDGGSEGKLLLGGRSKSTDSFQEVTSSTALNPNVWYHVVGILNYASNTATIYINGAQSVSSGVSFGSTTYVHSAPGSTYDSIGSNAGGIVFKGYIDEPKIYPYARTAAQIAKDYNAGLAGMGKSNEGTSASIGGKSNKWMTDGLVGHWKMDEASWNGTSGEVKDASGNANNGTGSGGVTTGAGKFGNGGNFDGSDDYVNAGNGSNLNITNAMTIGTWVKFNGLSSNSAIVSKFDLSAGSPYNGYALIIGGAASNRIGLNLNVNGAYSGTWGNTVLTTGVWYYLVATFTNGSVKLYVNGVDDGCNGTGTGCSPTGSISTNTLNLNIGENPNGGNKINGSIDETRIYNRALSPKEVADLYNYAPGPVGYWNMDDATGTTTKDLSGNGNNGTLGDSSYRPNWSQGKYGGGLSFDGTDDYVNVGDPSSGILDMGNNDFTLETWFNTNNTSNLHQYFMAKGHLDGYCDQAANAGYGFRISYGYLNFKLNPGAVSCGSVSGTTLISSLPTGWHHGAVVVNRSGNALIYLDGKLDGSASMSTNLGNSLNNSNNLRLGNYYAGNYLPMSGLLDEMKIYNYARTQKQIVEDMNGGHPAGGSPVGSQVGYWKFDEGQGTTANNSGNGGSTLNGTINGATWTNDGKFGKALSFDGSNDYANTSSRIIDSTNSFSVSGWVKFSSLSSNYSVPLWNGVDSTTGGFGLGYRKPNSRVIYAGWGSSAGEVAGPISTDNTWYYLSSVYDGSKHKFYVNGVLQGSVNFSTSNFASGTTTFGNLSSGNGYWFNGLIDEVKVYNYALTDSDIQLDYNQGKSMILGSKGTESDGKTPSNSASRAYCPPGNVEGNCAPGLSPAPVGEWKLDDGTGTTVTDTSGNANTGTLTNGPTWAQGKAGKAVKFDGTDDLIQFSTSNFLTNAGSISAWVKNDVWGASNTDTVIDLYDSTNPGVKRDVFTIKYWSSNSKLTAMMLDSSSNWYSAGATVTYTPNLWYHVEIVRSGTSLKIYINGAEAGSATVSSNNFYNFDRIRIGQSATSSEAWQGLIDDVKIFSYARTPAQIAWDYNQGKPVGWWKMDEGQGATVYDHSGNANNGTMTNMDPATDWVAGKNNSALDFDGSNDYVSVADNNLWNFGTNDFSINLWAKWTSLANIESILGQSTSGGNVTKWNLVKSMNTSFGYDNSLLTFHVYNGGNYFASWNWTASTNTWYNVAIVRSGNNWNLYVNGIQTGGTQTQSASVPNIATDLRIGSDGEAWNFLNGQIDDVRIYNYALSAEQVKQVMNEGAVRFK